MKKRGFWYIFGGILLLGFLLRIFPALGNNFYFTMDQGDDAVQIREILERRQILLAGPETGIRGMYAGPLWYYFEAIGYAMFRGHPFGGVFMLIVLNTFLLALIMLKIAKNVSPKYALLVGTSLLTSWGFYNASRYAFNPFPLVFLAFLLIFLLIDFLSGSENYYILAAIPVGLGFNTEVAGSVALALFYLVVGIWAWFKRKLAAKNFALALLTLYLFFVPATIVEVNSGFSQTRAMIREVGNPNGVFSGTEFSFITDRFSRIVSRSVLGQVPELGAFVFILLVVLLFKRGRVNKGTNQFSRFFVILSLVLFLVSWLVFASNKGWRDWQTVYLSPVIFVSVLLALRELPKEIALVVFTVVILSHLAVLQARYLKGLRPSDDPSILKNEMGVVDWVYKEAGGEGFSVYSYLPSVLDYPYQYLFWWQGRGKYGYLPCEYSTFPGAPGLFVPGRKYYREPKRKCSALRFLVVEPDRNAVVRRAWLDEVGRHTRLLEEATVGSILVQKRLRE